MANPTEHFCCCCLLGTNESNNPLANMKSESFVIGDKKITFYDGYVGVNHFPKKDFHMPEERICEICMVQLENAYLFQNLCRITNEILYRKYSKAALQKSDVSSYSDQRCDDSEFEDLIPANNTPPTSSVENLTNKASVIPSDLRRHKRKFRRVRNADLNQTTRYNSARKEFKCSYCKKTFMGTAAFNTHKIDTHGLNIQNKCKICSLLFASKTNLVRHRKKLKHFTASDIEDKMIKIQRKIYKCSLCPLTFSRNYSLMRHRQVKHATMIHEKCQICQLVFSSKQSLTKHELRAHPNNSFECEFCSKVFPFQPSLSRHKRERHTNDCIICKLVFNSRSELNAHSKIHPKIHGCGECEETFMHPTELDDHTRSAHDKNKLYKCDICSKNLESRRSIQRHMLLIHLNVGHECKICLQKYQRRISLWAHAFKHREFSPYNCNDCGYRTANKIDYRYHLSRKHKVTYDESKHGYTKETVEEVIAFVEDVNKIG